MLFRSRQLLKDEHQRRTEIINEQASREDAAQTEAKTLAASGLATTDEPGVSRRAFMRGKFSATVTGLDNEVEL